MRILFVHSPVDYRIPDSFRTESLGLGYLTSVLRKDGHQVDIFDPVLQRLNTRSSIDRLLSRDFDCVGITSSDTGRNGLMAIAKAVRKSQPSALIVAGGYLASLNSQQLLQACPELDFVVRGEGEAVASDVFGRIDRGEDWRSTPGVAFMADGQLVMNPVPPLIRDLDSIPFPARDALKSAPDGATARIIASRGCYHNCSFCSVKTFYALSGSRVPRFRSPENVVDEIESINAEMGISDFTFSDDDLIGPGRKMRERVMRLAEEIMRRNLKITFAAEFRADEIDAEILELLISAGLNEVFIGVESGVQAQLDRYNKGVTVEQNKRAIEIVRASGVKFRCGFIVFDPYTNPAEVQENMQFARETGIADDARKSSIPLVTKLGVFRGTPIEKRLREDGFLIERGLEIDWKPKDPSLRVMMGVSRTFGALSGLFKRLGKSR